MHFNEIGEWDMGLSLKDVNLPERVGENKEHEIPEVVGDIMCDVLPETVSSSNDIELPDVIGNGYENKKEEIENLKNCPLSDGVWDNERGNSLWKPDANFIPKKQNPEGKTWGKILEEYGISGIQFKDGEPNFSEVSKATVKIEGFSANRDDNFDKADIELAKEKGCSPDDVEKWRKENHYTWHECKDMKTMQKVPGIVHNNIAHRGGVSEIKKEV